MPSAGNSEKFEVPEVEPVARVTPSDNSPSNTGADPKPETTAGEQATVRSGDGKDSAADTGINAVANNGDPAVTPAAALIQSLTAPAANIQEGAVTTLNTAKTQTNEAQPTSADPSDNLAVWAQQPTSTESQVAAGNTGNQVSSPIGRIDIPADTANGTAIAQSAVASKIVAPARPTVATANRLNASSTPIESAPANTQQTGTLAEGPAGDEPPRLSQGVTADLARGSKNSAAASVDQTIGKPDPAATAQSQNSLPASAAQIAAQAAFSAEPAPNLPTPTGPSIPIDTQTISQSFAHEMRASFDSTVQSAAYTARGAVTAQPATEQIAVQIARAAAQNTDKLTVQLKPAELGKITIDLEVGPDNRLLAVIAAERSDTLDLLQRDARQLERALNDAGLKTDSGSLEFNLRGDGDTAQNGDGADDKLTDATIMMPNEDIPSDDATNANLPLIVPDGRVNIQV